MDPELSVPTSTVYPRACGGTLAKVLVPLAAGGLSPRLRGNPLSGIPTQPLQGSIPAPAGEPYLEDRRGSRNQVYPRACGGTITALVPGKVYDGLSPRLRGNRPKHMDFDAIQGSIPAPAGEPLSARIERMSRVN